MNKHLSMSSLLNLTKVLQIILAQFYSLASCCCMVISCMSPTKISSINHFTEHNLVSSLFVLLSMVSHFELPTCQPEKIGTALQKFKLIF